MANELQQIADLLREINRKVDSLPAELKISAKQVFATNLSQISSNLGLQTAGEFRSGNGKDPGSGFTGVRIVYPPILSGGVEYPFSTWNTDVLQVGIGLTDGYLYAGQGNVLINKDGITLIQGLYDYNQIKFINSYKTLCSSIESVTEDSINWLKIVVDSVEDSTESEITLTDRGEISFIAIHTEYVSNTGYIHIGSDKIRLEGSVYLNKDASGMDGYVGLTDIINSTLSSGVGSVVMAGTTNRNSTGWWKIMDGTTARYIPFWTDITG